MSFMVLVMGSTYLSDSMLRLSQGGIRPPVSGSKTARELAPSSGCRSIGRPRYWARDRPGRRTHAAHHFFPGKADGALQGR